jgi:hypothetical protein
MPGIFSIRYWEHADTNALDMSLYGFFSILKNTKNANELKKSIKNARTHSQCLGTL